MNESGDKLFGLKMKQVNNICPVGLIIDEIRIENNERDTTTADQDRLWFSVFPLRIGAGHSQDPKSYEIRLFLNIY